MSHNFCQQLEQFCQLLIVVCYIFIRKFCNDFFPTWDQKVRVFQTRNIILFYFLNHLLVQIAMMCGMKAMVGEGMSALKILGSIYLLDIEPKILGKINIYTYVYVYSICIYIYVTFNTIRIFTIHNKRVKIDKDMFVPIFIYLSDILTKIFGKIICMHTYIHMYVYDTSYTIEIFTIHKYRLWILQIYSTVKQLIFQDPAKST
eukprot:TRINITY_DN3629_c0_g1_i18.p2 TRINITY_DN3629_c0_g1~~TRINITY_DN3629_c0_g1_i18.p2  ORF type:complete len:203 (+),score=-15.37 TRINITY_DN3629_c0_g1_i18:226-834(+)